MGAPSQGEQHGKNKLRARQVEVDEIRAGARRAPPAQRTFDELASYWLEHRACEKRSRKDDVSIIQRHLVPVFGAMALASITVYSGKTETRASRRYVPIDAGHTAP